MARDLSEGIDNAYLERIDLLVVALTARTGSGSSKTASLLRGDFDALASSFDGWSEIEKRKLQICSDFLKRHWVPFRVISVSDVIFSYLLHHDDSELKTFFGQNKITNKVDETIKTISMLKNSKGFIDFEKLVVEHDRSTSSKAWEFYCGPLTEAASSLRKSLEKSYAPLFQTLGDNIRKSGIATADIVDPSKLFSLIVRVKRLAKAARDFDIQNGYQASTRVAIDAVRNPLELVYLRDQFAAFYVMAITAPEADRRERLFATGMTHKLIDDLDKREYSKKALEKYENFVSQNLEECIQKSDIFLSNPGKPSEVEHALRRLCDQLTRYIALMLRPGIVTPTTQERCMQLAFVAKLNSGCISRQVGASITDEGGSMKAVGWNDVPKGQVPCLLRDVSRLLGVGDQVAFSDFERSNSDYRKLVANKFENRSFLETSKGLHCPYCFKDTYNEFKKEKNQVHTRSLHAEENAFLQLAKWGNSAINGGTLYTTASPCELCSKKAFQLGIAIIYYVDPYPGISETHVIACGKESSRPKLVLFDGAIGNAYHRLYEPIMSIKDEFMARLNDDPESTLL